MTQTIGIAIGISATALMLLIVFIKANLVICQPNQVLIISGRRRKLPDGSEIGYRILRGGRGFRWPILESVSRIPLNNIPIEITITRALCQGIIPINIEGRANVKVAGSQKEGLFNAIERFLGKNLNEIAQVARETLEGNLRGVLATMTPEEANTERLQLAELVAQQASVDLAKLGLVLDFVKIQNISDDQGYLESIGRKRSAEVVKNARIAEATAEAEARMVSAEQKRRGSVAEAEAEIVIAEAENKLQVHRAHLAAETNRAQQRAKVAGEITRVEEEQVLEKARVELNRNRYEADTIVPAEAEKTAEEMRARGKAAQIIENGRATADAIQCLHARWDNGASRELFLIQMLPDLLNMVTRAISDNLHIEKLTIVDSGSGSGLPQHVKGITGSAIAILEQLKNATGLDVTSLLQQAANKGNGTGFSKQFP